MRRDVVDIDFFFAWENKSLWSSLERNKFLQGVARRINSSCSSGREEKKLGIKDD